LNEIDPLSPEYKHLGSLLLTLLFSAVMHQLCEWQQKTQPDLIRDKRNG